MLSCNQTSTEENNNAEGELKFQTNVTNFNNMIDAFADENHEQFMSVFADSLKWSGPEK